MMMLMTPTPVLPQDVQVGLPGFSGTAGEVLAAVAAEPAGPWLAVLLDGLDPTALTSVELAEYLRECDRVKNWADARATDAVAELSRRPDVTCADKEAALALRVPAGAAAQLIWVARQVTSRLPAVMRAFRRGDLSFQHVQKIVKATSRVTDPDLLDMVADRVLGRAAGRTADEVGRHARDVVRDLDPAGAQQRANDARAATDVVMYPADADGMTDIVPACRSRTPPSSKPVSTPTRSPPRTAVTTGGSGCCAAKG